MPQAIDRTFDQACPAQGCIRMLEVDQLWPALEPIESMYPDFRHWYWGKVVPGLVLGTRQIFWCGSAATPSAVAIAKKEAGESKICTVWVEESSRLCGHGSLLLNEAIEWLGTARPLFTIPAERYNDFIPLMQKFSFEETARIDSLYRRGIVEHIFNGNFTSSGLL